MQYTPDTDTSEAFDIRPDQPPPTLIDRKGWLYISERYGLTSRECQIAELVCQGDKNDTIAQTLSISLGTVKTHLRNIYRKVRVQSKIAMLLQFVAAIRRHQKDL